MILDRQLLLSENQDLSQTAANYLSTNSIDLGTTGTIPGVGGTPVSDVGRGTPKNLFVQVTETFTSGGAATLQVHVVSGTAVDGNGQLSAGVKIHNSSRVYALADLVAGKQLEVAIPPGIDQRYLALRYDIGTATTTAGTVTAGIVLDRQTNPTV